MTVKTPMLLTLVALLGVFALSTAVAWGETSAPGWGVAQSTIPTNLPPGGTGLIELDVYNVGAASSDGTVTVTDVLPKGLIATEASGLRDIGNFYAGALGWACSVGTGSERGRVVTCTTMAPEPPGEISGVVEEATTTPVTERDRLAIVVAVESGSARTETNKVTVAGGGALFATSVSRQVVLSSSSPGFGFADFDVWTTNPDGTPDTQAGSHPYELTATFNMNEFPGNGDRIRNINVNAPPGLVGDPTATPRCSRQAFDNQECSASTQIGIDSPGLSNPGVFPLDSVIPVYNIVPPKGIPAQFGFTIIGIHVFLDAGVRTGGDNGITEHVDNLVEKPESVVSNTITLWGTPAEVSHDDERCAPTATVTCESSLGASSNAEPKPLLTLPTSCGAPSRWTIEANSWAEPDNVAKSEVLTHNDEGTPVGLAGCEKLVHFEPHVAIAPDTSFSDTPAGLGVEVRMPPDTDPEGLATSGVKDTTVTLPEGVVINPGAATGLVACQPSEENIGGGEAEREEEEGPATCPAASKVGTDEVATPLLREKLTGSVYVLQQNPPNLQLLVTASGEGVNLKLIGNVHLNEQTGQLTTTFEETPDLPFTTFKLNFSGGAQAALATPVGCGVYSSSDLFVPWSSPFVASFPTGGGAVPPFQITSGPGGGACPGSPMPFTPSMVAGATTDQAGGYTDFSLLLSRPDGQQRISKLQFKTPLGLLGMISHVTLCGEPQASKGECPASSQIGHTVVGAGPGPYPLYIPEVGKPPAPIYITGPYEGAPYGLSIVVPVLAGPFNLGTVVVRGKIEVDPETSQLTITTDPLIQVLDGVPADLRTINAVIDRKEFMFNPTNCNPQSFSGTVTSIEGATAAVSSPFQVGSCRSLGFKPTFKATTSAKTSRTEGATLQVSLTLPDEGGLSSIANVQKVKVSLPKQLPSPLKTLQKACLEKTFEENPTNCPKASQVGTVKVSTPVLPGGLTGTAYFVSHGGAKYPELIMVLTGQNGVTVQVHGETFISKQGITSATFSTVPDVPFSDFELTLPEREYPALTANGNLCKAQAAGKLLMPTEIVGQNGLVIQQSTKIAVTGCPKSKRASHKRKQSHNKTKGKGKRG